MDGLVELFLFCGILYYFFSFRPNNMVDVVSTRLQVLYNKFDSRMDVRGNTQENTPRLTQDELRRANQQVQRRRLQTREQARRARETSLFNIKETEPISIKHNQSTPSVHYCCSSCTPSSRESLVNAVNKEHTVNGVNILVVNSGPSLVSKIFCHLSHVYSFRKYEYPVVTQSVLNDERLREAIEMTAVETAAEEGGDETAALEKAEQRARSILMRMQSTISDTLLRCVAWVLYKVLPCFIQSAVVQPSHVEMLKKANDTGLPLILLPLHRSHMDYIMISFLALINDIRNPLIAAGDNLRIPLLGWLLSGLGAFYIKRRIDPIAGRKDRLYRATLHTYIMEVLRAGHNIEFFIEGGRTRTGKPCMPKGGILSVIIDAYLDGTIEDALLVPVSMNYERLVDGNFVREQLGQPKKMETFASTIHAMWSTLMGNYGIVKVNVCQPFSLKEMLKAFQVQQNKTNLIPSEKPLKYTLSTSSLYGTDVVVEENRQLIDSIGRHVVFDCSKSTPIMSTNVVAFILLNKFREGCTLDKLVEEFESIRHELEVANKDLAFTGDSVDVINHALDILGLGLVKIQRQEVMETVDDQTVRSEVVTAIQPVSMLPNVIELSYYSNTLLTHYVMESAVVTALYSLVQEMRADPTKVAVENNIVINQKDLVDKALRVCDILKYEFIFCKPCQVLEEVIENTINNLAYTGVIVLKEEAYLEEELWSRRFARNFDDSSDEDHQIQTQDRRIEYKVNLDAEHSKRTEFLHVLLRSFIDTYTFSAYTLRKLVGRTIPEKEMVQLVLSEIKSRLESNDAIYGESLCMDPVKNSFKLFEKWNVIEYQPNDHQKMFYLKEDKDNESAVNQIYESIKTFRWNTNVD